MRVGTKKQSSHQLVVFSPELWFHIIKWCHPEAGPPLPPSSNGTASGNVQIGHSVANSLHGST